MIFIMRCRESVWGRNYVDKEQEACEGCDAEGEKGEMKFDTLLRGQLEFVGHSASG